MAFDFTSNTEDNVDKLTEDLTVSNDTINVLLIDKNSENREIIINNAFALADKKLKISLQEKWNKVTDYLTDKHYSSVAGKWTDAKLEVVGGEYIIFTVIFDIKIGNI